MLRERLSLGVNLSTSSTSGAERSFGPVAVLTAFVGLLILGYGLLLVPVSALGGLWIAAVGLCLLLSAAVSTRWLGDRLGLASATRRTLSLSFAALGLALLVTFVAVNVATFESGAATAGR